MPIVDEPEVYMRLLLTLGHVGQSWKLREGMRTSKVSVLLATYGSVDGSVPFWLCVCVRIAAACGVVCVCVRIAAEAYGVVCVCVCGLQRLMAWCVCVRIAEAYGVVWALGCCPPYCGEARW
jgi:hypothetical protein